MGHPAHDSSHDSSDDADSRPIPPARRGKGDHQPDWLVEPEEGLSAEVLSPRPSIPKLSFAPGGSPKPTEQGSSSIPLVPPTRPAAPVPARPVSDGTEAQLPRLGEPRPLAPATPTPLGGPPELSGDTRARAFRPFSGRDVDASLYAWKPSEVNETEEAAAVEAHHEMYVPIDEAAAREALRAWEEGLPKPGESRVPSKGKREDAKASSKEPGARSISFAWLMDRRLWIAVPCVAVVAVIAAFAWPKESPGVSISTIRKHAAELDGKLVTVKGRVGEVFPVGSSFVYYLHQGRDTLVVFSRSRAPNPKERLSVTGTISTGFLEGAPRAALFEQAP